MLNLSVWITRCGDCYEPLLIKRSTKSASECSMIDCGLLSRSADRLSTNRLYRAFDKYVAVKK